MYGSFKGYDCMTDVDNPIDWAKVLDSERYTDEMQYHEDLGYTRGYTDACKSFLSDMQQHKYWQTGHV
jgi:hypothetical protein